MSEENSYRSIREEAAETAMNPILEVTGFIDVDIEHELGRIIKLSFVEGMTDKYQRVTLDVTLEFIEDICKLFEANGIKTKITKTKL
jgi:hypothetical protein